MLYGPIFGGIAVVLTGLTTSLPLLGVTRLLEGASTAASVPSILGFIALATAGNELLRGKAAARFEGATLAGLGVGFIVAPKLFEAIGPAAFFLNAVIYGVSFLIYWRGRQGPGRRSRGRRLASTSASPVTSRSSGRRTCCCWPRPGSPSTRASGCGSASRSSSSRKPNPDFPDQALMRGFDANQITLAAIAIAVVFGVGLLYWGNRFKSMRRTTIILYGIIGGAVLVLGGLIVNHSAGLPVAVLVVAVALAAGGLFVLAGATPAALGLLADISERFPADRGAIMGLYSVFLAIGQIAGSLIGGFAADWRGIDGMLLATFALLAVALVPLSRLRRQEHEIDAANAPDRGKRGERVTDGRPWAPVPTRPWDPRRGRGSASPRDRGRSRRAPGGRHRRRRGDRHERRPRRRHAVGVRHRRRRVLAHLGRRHAVASSRSTGRVARRRRPILRGSGPPATERCRGADR